MGWRSILLEATRGGARAPSGSRLALELDVEHELHVVAERDTAGLEDRIPDQAEVLAADILCVSFENLLNRHSATL